MNSSPKVGGNFDSAGDNDNSLEEDLLKQISSNLALKMTNLKCMISEIDTELNDASCSLD